MQYRYGSGIMRKLRVYIVQQLKGLLIYDDSAFSYLLASRWLNVRFSINARKLATLNATLLIIDETDTGKDLLAHTYHLCISRGHKPFKKLNCAACYLTN